MFQSDNASKRTFELSPSMSAILLSCTRSLHPPARSRVQFWCLGFEAASQLPAIGSSVGDATARTILTLFGIVIVRIGSRGDALERRVGRLGSGNAEQAQKDQRNDDDADDVKKAVHGSGSPETCCIMGACGPSAPAPFG